MGIWRKIVMWALNRICRDVKVPISTLVTLMDSMDTDKDQMISVGEAVNIMVNLSDLLDRS